MTADRSQLVGRNRAELYRRNGAKTQIRSDALRGHPAPGVPERDHGLQRLRCRRHGAVSTAVPVFDQAAHVGDARPRRPLDCDAGRLPDVPGAGLHLVVAGHRRVMSDRGDVQPACEQRATLVQHRRPWDSAVGVGQAGRDFLHRGHARTPHAAHQRARLWDSADCHRDRGAGGPDCDRAGLRHRDDPGGDCGRDDFRGRSELHVRVRDPSARASAGRGHGHERRVPAPASPDVHEPVGRPARRWIPNHPVV